MKICKCGNDSFIPVPTMIFFTKDYSSHCTVVCAKCGKDYTAKIEFQLENIDSEYSGLRDTIRRLQKEIAEYWKEIEDLKSKNQCFSDSSKILQRALEEERTRYDKLREELKDIKYKLDVEKTENYEIQKENEGLKTEKANYDKLFNEHIATGKYITSGAEIDELRKEIEKLQKDKEDRKVAYDNNLRIIKEDLAEANSEKLELIDKLISIRSFASAICVLSHINTPVSCLAEEIFNRLKKYYNPVDSGLN